MEVNTTRRFNQVWLWVRMAVYVGVPLVLLLLPSDFFDNGQPLCLSLLLLDFECYGCGLTRSIMHLIHFEFTDAYYFNPLGFIVFPLLAWVWWRWFWRDWRRFRIQIK